MNKVLGKTEKAIKIVEISTCRRLSGETVRKLVFVLFIGQYIYPSLLRSKRKL